MTIELSASIERELRNLAVLQSRDVCELVEEAVRQYLEAAAITDLDTADVAETQAALAGELRDDGVNSFSSTSRESGAEARRRSPWRSNRASRSSESSAFFI